MHLVTLKDFSPEDVEETIELGLRLKEDPGSHAGSMRGQTLAMLFQKTSTRTRCAGEIGMTQMGGHAIYLDWRATNFGLADLGDEIRVISSYADLIVVRLLKHADVVRAARASQVPLMNGCCDRYHPMQALADITTIKEAFGRLTGVKLTYVGVHNNVCNSLIAAALKVGMEITVVAPETNPAARDTDLYQEASRMGLYKTETDLRAAMDSCDVVYTDTWMDMEYFDDPAFAAEKGRRLRKLLPYQLSRELLDGLDVRILHCLPAHHGYEIEAELLDDPRSLIFVQAENRLHSQKALILKLSGNLPRGS